jgi:phosphoglucosamine mutase
VLINVRDVDRGRVDTDEGVAAAVATAEETLGESGRVLLRPSGTEPVVRVMVEAADQATAESVGERLAAVVRDRLALQTAAS